MTCDATYEPNGNEVTDLASLVAAARAVSSLDRPGGVYFRGQARADWGLRPSIGRCASFGGRTLNQFTPDQERNLLHRFRRHTYAYFNRVLNEWEALFLARHHFLPVRLLDWTSSPAVGLYSACWETAHLKEPGAVWAIRRVLSEEHDLDLFTTSLTPSGVPGVKILHPFYGSPRITAQCGLFTIQDNPWLDLERYFPRPLPDRNFDLAALVRFTVPARSKLTCLDDLERLGINHRTLFPDLDGLARGLWQTEVLRAGIAV